MSGEFDFLDDFFFELSGKPAETQFSACESNKYVDSTKNSSIKSELEETLRKDNAKLRSRLRAYSKSLNEQGTRLTQLLTEKLSMREEQEKIQDCKKKLEEANLYIQATDQLNKQLHELAKTYANEKQELNKKIITLQKKVKKLKKEINGAHQRNLQEKKRKLKQLRILVELSEILLAVGLLPVKYKRVHDGWKFEVSQNEEDDEEGDNDVEEAAEKEEEHAESSSAAQVVQIKLPQIELLKSVSSGPKGKAPVDMMSESESEVSDLEGHKASSPPSKNPRYTIPIVDTVKASSNCLVNSADDMLRAGRDFGSTVTSSNSTLSHGNQLGAGSSFVGSKKSSESRIISPLLPNKSSFPSNEVNETDKVGALLEEENWHLNDDESNGGSLSDVELEVNRTIDRMRPMAESGKHEQREESLHQTEKSHGLSKHLEICAILKEMCYKPPLLLQPFPGRDLVPHSLQDLCPNNQVAKKSSEKLVEDVAISKSVSHTADKRVTVVPAPSCAGGNSSSQAPKDIVLYGTFGKGTKNIKDTSAKGGQADVNVAADRPDSKSSSGVSPPGHHGECEIKDDDGATKKIAAGNLNDVGASNRETGGDLELSQKENIRKSSEVSGDLSPEISIGSNAGLEKVSSSLKSSGAIVEEGSSSILGEKSVECQRGKSMEISLEEESNGNKDVRKGRGRPRKKRQKEEGEAKEKECSGKDGQDNMVTSKASPHTIPTPLNEECPRRFSLRPRKKAPGVECTDPSVVNNSAQVPTEVSGECPIDSSSGKDTTISEAKKGIRDLRSTRKLVDYSDNSDSCDSMVHVNLALERTVRSEQLKVADKNTNEVAVGSQEYSERSQKPESNEAGSGVITEPDKDNQPRNIQNKYEPKGDIPCIMEESVSPAHSDEQLSQIQVYNDLRSESCQVLGSAIDEKSAQIVTNDSTTGAEDVGSLPCIENCLSSMDSLETTSAEDCELSIPESLSSSSTNDDSSSVAGPEEVNVNSCHSQEDQESEESEIESDVTLVDSIDCSEGLPHSGGILSPSNSSFSLSSDGSSGEYSDALSVLDKCEGDMVEFTNILEQDDADKKEACEFRRDAKTNVSAVPMLKDCIPSMSISESAESSTLGGDYSSPIAKRQMGNEPLQKSHDLNKLTGTEYPKKCTSNEIYNKEQLSLDDQHIHVQAKNLSHPVDEKLTKLVSSKGVDPPKIQQPMVKLSAEPDQKLSSNTCLSEENHALPVADGSQLIQVEKEKRAESSVLIPSSCQSHVIQAENSGKESVEKKHLKDFETFSERTFSMDDSNVKNSLPPIKDHPAKYSLGGSSSAKLLTSAPEKRRNLVGVAQHGKDISVIGGNAPSKEMKCRQTVPLLFGKLNLFRFPGVKFRISGCFASEFYPEPYLVPKFPLISFGHGDFHELYELLKEKNAAKQPKALVPLEVKFYKRGTFAPLNFTDLYLNPKRLSINMGHRRRKVNFIPEGDNNSSSLSDCVAECGHLNEDAFKDNSQICAPGLGYEENCESSSKDGSSTLGDDQESSCESMISVCDQVNVAVSSDVISNVFMSKVHGPKNASIHETKKSEPNVQICHEKEFSALRPGRAGSSEGLGGDQNNSGEIKQRDLDAQCEGDLASNGIDKSIGDLKQLAASDTVASNILMQEDPKKLKNDNLSNLTSQTEGIRPRGLGDKDENYRNIVQSANQDERDSNESRLKVKDKAGSGTCKNSVMSPCSEKPNVGVVTGKKDEDSLTHDLEIAEAVSRNEDNGGKLVEGKNMEQNSDGDMAGDEGIDDVIVTINPGGSTADTGLKPHSSSGSVIFDADESNLLQNRLPLNLPAKEGEEKGLMDVFAPERVNKVGHISEEKTQKELKANSSFKLKTGSNVFQNLFSEKSTCVNMSMQANSKPASLGITVVATNEIPEAARASDAMPIDKCLMAENFDGMSELAGRLQTFRGTEAIETSETISQEKSLNKLPIKTKSNNCTAIDVNLMDVSTHKSKESTSSSESMQGSTSISMEKERNGIKSFSVGSKDESTKDFSGEKRIGDNSSSPTKSKKKSNIDCTEERSMNEVSDECLDNKTEESISSSGSVSFAKRAIAKEASEKSLFGTDLSDASLDSEPVVDPVPISRRRKKRWTKIAYSSESEDGCEERKKENEEQSPPGKRIKLGGKKRKSFASKSNASFGLLPPNGSVDSVRTPDGVISQSPRRKADLPPNPSCGRAVAENTDEEGEPDDGLQSSINGSSAGPSSRKSNLNTTVTEDAIFDDNSKSDVDVPMPSVKGGHNKNSHLPIASAPPLCKGLSRIANYSPKTYASRKSKTLKNQSPILEAPKNVEAKDLNIPGKFCGVQTDNGLGANSVTSFPEEEETFSMSTKKGEIESTENVIKDTESTSKIPPATSPSGGKKNGKQSFIGSVRCDDATFIGEGGMEETTFLLEETGEGSLVNAVNAPGVCASASTGRKSKGTKNERVPPSPGRLNKKCGGKEDIVRDRTEQNGSSDECVANFPKVLTTVVECGTSSAKKSSLKLHSNWRCNKDESKPSIEEGQLRSVRESVSISKLHPKARNTKSKAKSSPEFVHSSESDSEGETKSLEGGRCNELVVYVAHASEASPKLTKDRSSFVMGKGSEDKVGSSEGEGKKEKHNAGVTGMIVNLNNTTMNSRKPRMHANKNNDEDSTNLSTDQLFRFPLKKGIGNISQATECLSSPTPTILKGYSSDGKVVAENNKKEEILLEESGTTPSFERHNVFATKLVPTGNDFVENKQKLNSFIERDALKQVSISSLPSFNSKGADLTRACNIGLGGGVNISGKIQPRVLSEDCVIDHGSSGFDKSSGDMKQFGASATLISNILVQEDPKKLKNNNLSNLTSQTEGVRPRGLRDNDENNRSIVQSADQGERDSDESRLKAKDEAESGTCKNSVMSPCFEKLNVGVVTGKKDKDSLTHDLEIAEAVSRNEDNGGKLVEGKNMEQNSDGDMGGDEVIDDIIMTIIPGDSMADIGLKTGSSTESVIFDSDDSNLLQIDLSSDLSTIPIKQAEEKGLMDLFASESINKIGQICEDKTQKELMANSFFELKTGANVLQTLFSNESTYVTMPRQANSSSALVVSSEVDTNEFPEAALNERASDAMHIEKCLMAENLDALIELAGGLQSFLGSEVIEETESMSEEKCLNKLPIKTKSNNCTAIDVNLMDVSTHNSSSESMQGSTSISMEKERNGIKSFSVGSKDESTKDFSGEKRIGDSSSSPTKSKKKSNIGCTEARSMNEVSDECLDNKTEESISSSGSVSFAKRAIAKEASEKSLFGTDLSDASLDSEPVVDPVPISRRRKKRRTKIAYSSESEDGGVERREGNEEQPPPGKRIKLGGKKRKSFASKCNAIFGSLSPNGSVDSVRTPDGVISQSPRRKADLPPNPSCSRAVAENTDEEGKPDDGLQSSINGSSAGPSSSNSNLNSAVTKVAIFDYNSKSDVDVPMPSVKGGHNKNSHVPIASAPPLCQGLSRIANYSPKTYASRKSKTLKSQSPILEAPKNVEAEDLNIPGKFCGVQTDNGLGANSVTSFPEEEETFSLSTKKGETVYTENATKDTESTTQIPPATSPGRRKNRKQSFIGSVRCDDATFIGEGGMAETTFLLEETGEGSLVNAVNAPGVCASASTGRKSKGTKNERVPPSPGRLKKKCGGKEDIVHDRTEQNGSTDECVTNLPKVLTTAAECGTSSAKKSSLKLRSNWRCNKDESKPSTEKGQLRSVRESVSISKLHPKARKTKSKAKSSPEFVRSSESDSEGETKSLEGGRCNELVVYVAHASEASPKLTKDRSSFVMGKGSEDKVGSSEGEGKKEKHNAGVTGMIVNLNNTTMNSRKPRMHANKNNDEDSTNLSTDQLFSLPLKKRIANIPQATECLNSLTPKILKDNLSAEGKVATPKDMKEEILNEEVGYKPPFKKRIATAPKLVAPVRVLKTQVPVNSSLSSMSLVKNENNTVLSYDQEYVPPTKKRTAHIPKGLTKIDNSFPQTENVSNANASRMSDVKGTLPVAEQNYNQSTKKRICRIPKSLSTTPTAEHCKSSLTKTRGGSCRQKRPLSGGESDQQKSCGSDKRKIRRSPRKKIQELRPFPKKRHLPTDNVGESFQPDNIEEEELPKGDAFDSVTAVDVGMDPSKSPKRKALDGYKPDFLKKPTETILKMTSQKEKMNDSLLAGVVQENLLEEMEAPPLSPLSDDVLVDSLIIFPDSSSESPSEEDIKSVDIDTAQELSIKHDLKKVITAEKPREINELPITKDISTTLGVAMEESMDVADVNDREAYMKVVDHQGDKDAAPKQSQSCPPDSGKVSPSTLISVLEGISNDWRNSKDYFNKMLKQVQLENAGKEKSKNVPCRLSANLRKILKAQLGRLNGKHFGNSILNGIIAVISDDSNGFKSKNVAKYLIRMLSKEDEDDVQPAMLPGAPRMTCLQMRVLSLVLALENRCPNFSDLSEVMLDGISFILFRLGHCPDVEVVKTLARMYTVFCMAKNDIMRARCFCFDALFSIATKAVELITVVICMWHEVLPVQDSSRVPSYIESSVFMAISHVTATKNPVVQKNISALKRIVYNMYKAEFHKITFEQFLDKLMLHLSGGGNLQGLEPAAVLMAKRQGWEWTHKNLLCGRLVSLMENWKQNRPFTSSAVTAVNLIGLTSRSCPIETSGPVKNIIETLSRTLIKEPCDDPSIKEALVVALIRLSKYHMYHIVRALDIWRPMREPPEEVKNAIRGLILRPSCQKFFRVKYRSWKTPVVNRCKKGGYFERSKLLDSNEISAGGNEGEDEDYFEGIEEEKAGGEVESGKCWLPNKDRLKYKVWVKEEKNEEWVNSEVKKWDGTAFKRSNRRKRRKLNNARASEG